MVEEDKKRKYNRQIISQVAKNKPEKESFDPISLPSENPNPVFCINTKLEIIYINEPAKSMFREAGLTGKIIPKKLIDSLMVSFKKKDNKIMTLEHSIGDRTYEFLIVKIKGTDHFNIYGNDITKRKKLEKSSRKIEKEEILLNERNYIARELHDTVTQTLFSANLIAEVLPKLWKKDPGSVLKRLDEIRTLNNVALTEMRSLLFDLRPSSFKNEDLGQHLRELVKSIGIKSKIPVSVEIVKKYEYPHKIEISFYRIAQEALNNIAKHSGATKAELVLKCLTSKITMVINDNGSGFDERENSTENLGLIIMQERASMIGADFTLVSNPGKGTKISVIYNNNNREKNNE
jgi:signal transduction histidine kinase